MFKDPVFVSLFLLVFGFFWILLCGLLSWQTGWVGFTRRHPLGDRAVLESLPYTSIQFNYIGSYSYSMVLTIHADGLGLRPMLLFRAFHAPLFIPWNEIESIREGKEFFWYPVLDIYIEGKKIRFYGKAIEKIKEYYSTQKTSIL
jgi:hypothetical protein